MKNSPITATLRHQRGFLIRAEHESIRLCSFLSTYRPALCTFLFLINYFGTIHIVNKILLYYNNSFLGLVIITLIILFVQGLCDLLSLSYPLLRVVNNRIEGCIEQRIPVTLEEFNSLGVCTREEAILYVTASRLVTYNGKLLVRVPRDTNKLSQTLLKLPCSSQHFPKDTEFIKEINSLLQGETSSLLDDRDNPYKLLTLYKSIYRLCRNNINADLKVQLDAYLNTQQGLAGNYTNLHV